LYLLQCAGCRKHGNTDTFQTGWQIKFKVLSYFHNLFHQSYQLVLSSVGFGALALGDEFEPVRRVSRTFNELRIILVATLVHVAGRGAGGVKSTGTKLQYRLTSLFACERTLR
jgi:hypothetical protein